MLRRIWPHTSTAETAYRRALIDQFVKEALELLGDARSNLNLLPILECDRGKRPGERRSSRHVERAAIAAGSACHVAGDRAYSGRSRAAIITTGTSTGTTTATVTSTAGVAAAGRNGTAAIAAATAATKASTSTAAGAGASSKSASLGWRCCLASTGGVSSAAAAAAANSLAATHQIQNIFQRPGVLFDGLGVVLLLAGLFAGDDQFAAVRHDWHFLANRAGNFTTTLEMRQSQITRTFLVIPAHRAFGASILTVDQPIIALAQKCAAGSRMQSLTQYFCRDGTRCHKRFDTLADFLPYLSKLNPYVGFFGVDPFVLFGVVRRVFTRPSRRLSAFLQIGEHGFMRRHLLFQKCGYLGDLVHLLFLQSPY